MGNTSRAAPPTRPDSRHSTRVAWSMAWYELVLMILQPGLISARMDRLSKSLVAGTSGTCTER